MSSYLWGRAAFRFEIANMCILMRFWIFDSCFKIYLFEIAGLSFVAGLLMLGSVYANDLDCLSSYDQVVPLPSIEFHAPFSFAGSDGRYRLDGLVVEVLADPALEARRRYFIEKWIDGANGSIVRHGKKRSQLDRYGRQKILLIAPKQGHVADLGHSLQFALVQAGLGRVDPDSLSRICAMRFLAYERVAQVQKLGLWSIDHYKIHQADSDHLSALVSTYQHVRGRVLSVFRSAKGTSYLNFGHHWKTDFTVALGKKARMRWEGDEKSLEDLQGASIYVRGWIEIQNGPMIRVKHPEQLTSDVGDTKE